MSAVESVKSQHGNRAVLAILDHFDGKKYDELYLKLWDQVLDADISFTTIGVRGGWDYDREFLGNTHSLIFQELAYSTQGQFFHAPSDKQVQQSAITLLSQLTGSVPYRFKANWEKEIEPPEKPKGPGYLSVVASGPGLGAEHPPQIALILDASGSMRESKKKIDGRLKIEVAKDVMTEIIEGLSDDVELALSVYGHRIKEGRPGDCQDSQLMVPFGKRSKSRLLQQVQKLKALGTTPLAYSLEEAAEDFPKGSDEKLIVLVTDGKEECGGEPAAVAEKLARAGLNLRVNVVGFALADEKTKQNMKRVAEITGGRFFDAQNRQGLRASLQSALAVSFDVVDASGVEVGSGMAGQGAIQVPEGVYTVFVRGAGEPIVVPDVRIIKDRYCQVAVKKEGQEIGTKILGPMARAEAEQVALSGPVIERIVYLPKEETLVSP